MVDNAKWFADVQSIHAILHTDVKNTHLVRKEMFFISKVNVDSFVRKRFWESDALSKHNQ